MTADDRIGQIQILDHRLQFSGVMLLNLTAENDGDFVGLSYGAVGVQEPLTEGVDRSTARKDQIVAILDLRKEQPMFDTRLLSFTVCKKWSQLREPFPAASG